jgi:tetratricopeptide (TPR) repeat protein
MYKTRSFIRAGNLDKALSYAKQQVAANPEDATSLVALGEAQLSIRKAPESIATFKQALKLDPCNAPAHYNTWRLQSLVNETSASVHELDIAHALDPSDPTITGTWNAVQSARQIAQLPDAPAVIRLNPPLQGFFGKSMNCGSIPVRSSVGVHDDALVLACARIQRILANLPDARKRLHDAGSELHIIGEREATSDLPENRMYKTSFYIDSEGHYTNLDRRTRGVGGLYASCGEENLLFLPADRYQDGSDLCTHEFAHVLRRFGLSGKQRSAIDAQYTASIKLGIWKNAYAAVSADEFFSEMSMWYFGSHGQLVPGSLTAVGPAALQLYDPATFALLQSIYNSPPPIPDSH